MDWMKAIRENDIEGVKEMINVTRNFDYAWCFAETSEMREILKPYISERMRLEFAECYNIRKIPNFGNEKNYAVVSWFNYRKEHSAGCHAIFEKYEDAVNYAYKNACFKIYDRITCLCEPISDEDFIAIEKILQNNCITSELEMSDQEIIKKLSSKYKIDLYITSEDEITDGNGPSVSNYDTIVSYANSDDGYCSNYYCVVDYFPGVENYWTYFDGLFQNNEDSDWSPQYVDDEC